MTHLLRNVSHDVSYHDYRWSFLIGDEPCTVINKPPKVESPVIEEVEDEMVEEEAYAREEEQQIEVIIEEVQEEKEEEEEKAEVEATKVGAVKI